MVTGLYGGAMPKNYKWGIGAVPYSVPGVKGVCLYTDPLEIARTSKYPDEAWEFVKYLVSPPVQKTFIEETGRVSSRPSLREEYIEEISSFIVNTEQEARSGIEWGVQILPGRC